PPLGNGVNILFVDHRHDRNSIVGLVPYRVVGRPFVCIAKVYITPDLQPVVSLVVDTRPEVKALVIVPHIKDTILPEETPAHQVSGIFAAARHVDAMTLNGSRA